MSPHTKLDAIALSGNTAWKIPHTFSFDLQEWWADIVCSVHRISAESTSFFVTKFASWACHVLDIPRQAWLLSDHLLPADAGNRKFTVTHFCSTRTRFRLLVTTSMREIKCRHHWGWTRSCTSVPVMFLAFHVRLQSTFSRPFDVDHFVTNATHSLVLVAFKFSRPAKRFVTEPFKIEYTLAHRHQWCSCLFLS